MTFFQFVFFLWLGYFKWVGFVCVGAWYFFGFWYFRDKFDPKNPGQPPSDYQYYGHLFTVTSGFIVTYFINLYFINSFPQMCFSYWETLYNGVYYDTETAKEIPYASGMHKNNLKYPIKYPNLWYAFGFPGILANFLFGGIFNLYGIDMMFIIFLMGFLDLPGNDDFDDDY